MKLSKAAQAKIADLEAQIRKIKAEECKQGDLFKCGLGIYMLCQVGRDKLRLICIFDGNRYSDDEEDPFDGDGDQFEKISGSLKFVKSK